jgi:hypothetical protein
MVGLEVNSKIMPKLSLHLLGAPRIILGDQAVDLDTRKAVALLAYLAVTGQRHTRDSLVAFLWPEYDQQRGRAALRRTLSTLKSAVGGYGLAIERESLGLDWSADIWVDVLRFKDLLGQTRNHGHAFDESCPACLAPLSEAVDLYPGDFMSGFSLRDSPPSMIGAICRESRCGAICQVRSMTSCAASRWKDEPERPSTTDLAFWIWIHSTNRPIAI